MDSTKSNSHEFKTTLFFSVDIVNSTKYKQEGDPGNWVANFKVFYKKFPAFLRKAVEEEVEQNRIDDSFLWKSLGDELIFRVQVKTLEEITSFVGCFHKAVKAYKEEKDYIKPPSKVDEEQEEKETTIIGLGLDLKGSCFTIVTPYPDVCLDDEDVKGLFQGEYIGPGVDTGFRVVHKAEADSFAVSVEVAYAIAKTKTRRIDESAQQSSENVQMEAAKLYSSSGLMFVEYISLKGVWGELCYPLFALQDKKTEDIQDKLDLKFKRTINHDLSFKEVAEILEEVLLSRFPLAFLWVDGDKEEDKLRQAVENAKSWQEAGEKKM